MALGSFGTLARRETTNDFDYEVMVVVRPNRKLRTALPVTETCGVFSQKECLGREALREDGLGRIGR
jgi:hypothetical protein